MANNNQITSLTREIATLTATLQREKQRRQAIASYAKEVEHRADTAETKLKQVQYANRKLEEELSNIKENDIGKRVPDDENAELKAQITQLRTELAQSRARQEELMQLTSTSAVPTTATTADVDAAVKELSAIVPQYRASIIALQGRIAVLNKQLEQVTAERDQLQRDAASWRDASQRNEASFADVAAKLHSQEAASLASMTSSQQLAFKLEAELSSLRQQYAATKAELKEARHAAQQAQQAADSQQKLLATQSNTISKLENTVREQQEDIIAALDLVTCHHKSGTPIDLGASRDAGASTSNRGAAHGGGIMNTNSRTFDIDANLDLLDTIGAGFSGVSGSGGAAPASKAPAASLDVEEENWTIPAAGAGECVDDLATWLHVPLKHHTSPFKTKKRLKENLGAAACSKNNSTCSTEMKDLAADIAALRDALQRVL